MVEGRRNERRSRKLRFELRDGHQPFVVIVIIRNGTRVKQQ
jgi:hypothetical protein